MAREEMIRYGKDYLRDLETACCKIDELHLNFVRESIKALEQEPCDDCVSRQEVITIIQNHWWNCRDIDKLVNDLPPATPTRKKGRWIEVWDKEHFVMLAYKCSECGTMRNTKANYCADCGAEMEDEE